MKLIITVLIITSPIIGMEGIGVVESYMSGNQSENKPTYVYREPKNEPIKLAIVANYEPANESCGVCFKEKPSEEFKWWPCFENKWAHKSCYMIMNNIEEKHKATIAQMVASWTKENKMEERWNAYFQNKILKYAREQLKGSLLRSDELLGTYIEKKDGGIRPIIECYDKNIKKWAQLWLQVDGNIFKRKQERIRRAQAMLAEIESDRNQISGLEE